MHNIEIRCHRYEFKNNKKRKKFKKYLPAPPMTRWVVAKG
jgi:hypothetical protein